MSMQATTGLPNFVRLSGSAARTADLLGPLASLVGTWFGNKGWNTVAVPAPGNNFTLLVQPIVETMTFTPIGALVPDRGNEGIMQIPGLHYELQVADAQTNQALHIENGMWLLFDEGEGQQVARLCSVPHGNSVLAMGKASRSAQAPAIPDVNAVPDTGKGVRLGYLDPWMRPNSEGFAPSNPNAFIRTTLEDQLNAGTTVSETVTLDVSTATPGGGILNIPFITKNADCRAMNATFWVETMTDKDGNTFQQMQYSQQVDLFFIPKFDDKTQLIKWPHMTVNTLVKQ